MLSFAQTKEKEVLENKKAKIQKEIKLTNSLLNKAKKEKNQSCQHPQHPK
jgi:hypothetical protein